VTACKQYITSSNVNSVFHHVTLCNSIWQVTLCSFDTVWRSVSSHRQFCQHSVPHVTGSFITAFIATSPFCQHEPSDSASGQADNHRYLSGLCWAFPVVGLWTWNDLSDYVTSAKSLSSFPSATLNSTLHQIIFRTIHLTALQLIFFQWT